MIYRTIYLETNETQMSMKKKKWQRLDEKKVTGFRTLEYITEKWPKAFVKAWDKNSEHKPLAIGIQMSYLRGLEYENERRGMVVIVNLKIMLTKNQVIKMIT
jgi:hypothetical protein